jgi:hypothetical protein
MALETSVTYISDLNILWPVSGDPAAEVDNHLRNIKKATKNTFPNVTSVVGRTQGELNTLISNEQNLAVALKGKTATGLAVSGGSSTAYTLATGVSLTTIAAGFTCSLKLHATCGADPTLNIDTVGALDLVDKDGTTFGVGDLPVDVIIVCKYNGTELQIIGGLLTVPASPVFSNYVSYSSDGTFTVPAAIYKIRCKILGAGAAGENGSVASNSGGAGGSGAYGVVILPVTPGQQLPVNVGGGGGSSVGDGVDGIDGEDSTVTDNANTVVYIGGGGNGGNGNGTGGTGGSILTSGVGTPESWIVSNSGSSGGAGGGATGAGGGGGGSPGSSGSGNAGNVGGATDGGDGGDGSGGALGGDGGTSTTLATVGADGVYAGSEIYEGGGGGGGGGQVATYADGYAGGIHGAGGGGGANVQGGTYGYGLGGAGAKGRVIIEY